MKRHYQLLLLLSLSAPQSVEALSCHSRRIERRRLRTDVQRGILYRPASASTPPVPPRRWWWTQLAAAPSSSSSPSDAPSPPPPRRNFAPPRNFLLQAAALVVIYTFHLTVLTQHVAILGGRIPVGYDSLAGAAVAVWYFGFHRRPNETAPWHLPAPPTIKPPDSETRTNSRAVSAPSQWQAWMQNTDWRWIRFRMSTAVTVTALVKAYFQTGTFSLFWEDTLYSMSAAGWPLTVPLSRSLQVLAGHLSWVAAGSTLLWAIPRPPPFFKRPNNEDEHTWFRLSSKDWLTWTIGGYFVSSWLFNVANVANRYILPARVLQEAAESVVTQLVQPENNDFWASATGYIAPCITAPVWEELLYRGFLLAGLTASTGSWHASCFLQAVLFSAHHMSVTAALPLVVLGWTWAVLYTHSRNLLTVIAVHAMWNSRVFFGSWFGL